MTAAATLIRVLSVQQPHADCILYAGKWCENRSWRTNYRGELFIHASRMDRAALEDFRRGGVDPVEDSPGHCQTGAIIGRVQLLDVVHVDELELLMPAELLPESVRNKPRPAIPEHLRDLAELLKQASDYSWNYVSGDWCWILTDPEPLCEPIPMGGKLNVWTCSVDPARLQFAAVEA